ncbi:MAG: lipopolysaccharide kinase InaA family protein [Methylobacillus sp.]|jgi:hypothetical protein|nr:lipopolysaccharide kinase InaA family protein [Methylobacillus sp.]
MTRDYINPEWRETLAANGLDDFARLWPVAENAWFEPPNHARGGWSGVTRQTLTHSDGGTTGIFVKRQENHAYRSWRNFFRLTPTLEREFRNCMKFIELGIPALEPLFYGERRADGKLQAILVTRELQGYASLESAHFYPPRQIEHDERKRLIVTLAELVRKLHAHRYQHTSLYLKHLFARKNPDGSFDARFIDLEKTRWQPLRYLAVRRDLDSLLRHANGWSRTDCLRFFLAYRREKKLGAASRRLLRVILRKRGG